MKASSLDILEKSQLPPGQARAILQVMESELTVHDSVLATKADLLAVKGDLLAMKADLELKIEGLRTEMYSMRAELIGEIKGTVRWNFAFWAANLATMVAILKLLK
jgi:hypothetical protein